MKKQKGMTREEIQAAGEHFEQCTATSYEDCEICERALFMSPPHIAAQVLAVANEIQTEKALSLRYRY